MFQTLLIAQIVLSIGIVVLILAQAQGSGLGAAWGGGGETYHTRRGVEKVIFTATIVLTALFTINSVALLLLS